MNNSKTEINNGWTVQDEILYRDILEEEVVHGQKIQTYDEIPQLNVAQRPIKEVNKEVKEIKNQDCYDHLYNEIMMTNKSMMANKSSNKQHDWALMDFDNAEDETDIKIIQTYNRLILKKNRHTSK